MTTREQAMQWWIYLNISTKIKLVNTNTELLIKGIGRSWENLTDREIEKVWRKETQTEENIYLNRLKEQYKVVVELDKKFSRHEQTTRYLAMRLFCLDTQLISFNDIELMESEINSSF